MQSLLIMLEVDSHFEENENCNFGTIINFLLYSAKITIISNSSDGEKNYVFTTMFVEYICGRVRNMTQTFALRYFRIEL